MVAIALSNAVSPTCALNLCLQQVAGLLDNHVAVQYDACTSAFGALVTTTYTVDSAVYTVTVPGETFTDGPDVIWVTITETASDFITQWDTVYTTATETSTVVVTQTANAVSNLKVRDQGASKKKKKRGHCAPRTSTTPTTSIDVTTSAPEVSIPTNCANLEEFSSACKCITAASDVGTVTVTVTEATTTYAVTATQDVWTTATETLTFGEIEDITYTLSSTTTLTTTTTVVTTSTTTVPPPHRAMLRSPRGRDKALEP